MEPHFLECHVQDAEGIERVGVVGHGRSSRARAGRRPPKGDVELVFSRDRPCLRYWSKTWVPQADEEHLRNEQTWSRLESRSFSSTFTKKICARSSTSCRGTRRHDRKAHGTVVIGSDRTNRSPWVRRSSHRTTWLSAPL